MEEDIISQQEIRQILATYHIGKKPLAMLLGWGETTVLRYLEGAVPTREYSRRLKELRDNPEVYYELLTANKGKITKAAFQRSMGAFWQEQAASSIGLAAHYLFHCFDGNVFSEYLQYMLYYCQGFSLGLYGEPFFEADCYVNESHTFYKENLEIKKEMLLPLPICEKNLTPRKIQLAKAVVSASQWYGAAAFCQIHNLERKRLRIARNKQNEKIITDSGLESFFREAAGQYSIEGPKDISKYIDEAYRMVRNW